MKNIRLYAAIIVSLSLCLYVVGCGSAASSSSGTSTAVSGTVSDPHISGAMIFNDINGNDTFDPTIEACATTDGSGGFSFGSAPAAGTTLEMLSKGTHLGRAYDGAKMKKRVDAGGYLNITPLTDWVGHGIPASTIESIMNNYAQITFNANDDIGPDPMGGLGINVISSINDIKRIKAAIVAYSVSRICSDYAGTPNYSASDLTSTFMQTVETAVASAVADGISDILLAKINATIDATALLTGHQMPHATADQVARSAFNIAKFIADKKINSTPKYSWPVSSEAILKKYGQALGMRYYMWDNYYTPPLQPGTNKSGVQLAIESGTVTDEWGITLHPSDIDPGPGGPANPTLVLGFDINISTGTVESLY